MCTCRHSRLDRGSAPNYAECGEGRRPEGYEDADAINEGYEDADAINEAYEDADALFRGGANDHYEGSPGAAAAAARGSGADYADADAIQTAPTSPRRATARNDGRQQPAAAAVPVTLCSVPFADDGEAPSAGARRQRSCAEGLLENSLYVVQDPGGGAARPRLGWLGARRQS